MYNINVEYVIIFFFKQKTAYEMRISDWSSDVCSSDLMRAAFEDKKANCQPAGGSTQKSAPGSKENCNTAGREKTGRRPATHDSTPYLNQIGRASCRERVCQYV